MGKAITQVLFSSKNLSLAYAIEKQDSIYIGMDAGTNLGLKHSGVLISENMEEAIKNSDAVIDFSSHGNLKIVLDLCIQHKKSIVNGVTGFTEEENSQIKEASKSIAIVHSPNMSVGVNLLFKLVQLSAKVLNDGYDIEILDIHHKHKKDAPSGTAQKLKQILLQNLDRTEKDVVYGRKGNLDERKLEEIGIHTMRAGEVVGDHTVYFLSPEEHIELKHSAKDRKTFAVGAVRAAEFVIEKDKGLYDMFDVLGI